MNNRICSLLNITYPIIQGGMVWCSGWRLASAVSNGGGLGTLGSGSMRPDLLKEHIQKMKASTQKTWAVNIPLFFKYSEEHIQTVIKEKVPVVITSAGNPATYTQQLKDAGIVVMHVVPNVKLAQKSVDRGVDAVICEGFEAGGHNGREEITTLALTPQVVDAVGDRVPVVSAGGIGDGRAIAAALALGADAVQIGSRFAATIESSAHDVFKKMIVDAKDGDTLLTLKELAPVRLLKSPFLDQVLHAYASGANKEDLIHLLASGRARKGIFEGNIEEGEFEIGQVSGLINTIPSVSELMQQLVNEYRNTIHDLGSNSF